MGSISRQDAEFWTLKSPQENIDHSVPFSRFGFVGVKDLEEQKRTRV
jgi:hypothetical protein